MTTISTGVSLIAKPKEPKREARREQEESMEQMVRCPDCWREVRAWVEGEPVNFCPRCQFPLKVVADKYKLEARLGAGAFGTVYRARHMDLDTLRAIKVMRWDTANSRAPDEWTSGRKQRKQREFEARFQTESRLTALLAKECWHIVRLDDAGADDVLGLYYIMEYLDGAPLRQLMSDWPCLARRIAFSIMEQICRGVATAHRMGVIHRDLKPENIILLKQEDAGRYVKILDFGLAKLLGDEALQLTSRPMGTPLYMSPEQCANRPADQRADIYALGCIFFHLLTGTPPFDDAVETPQLFIQHLQAPPPSLRERAPGLEAPEGFDLALQAAMAKSPDDRPASVEAFWNSVAPFARWHEQIWRYGAAQADRQATFFPPGADGLAPKELWTSGETRLTPHHMEQGNDFGGQPYSGSYSDGLMLDSGPIYAPHRSRRYGRKPRWRRPALLFAMVMLLWFGAYWGYFRDTITPSKPTVAQQKLAQTTPPKQSVPPTQPAATSGTKDSLASKATQGQTVASTSVDNPTPPTKRNTTANAANKKRNKQTAKRTKRTTSRRRQPKRQRARPVTSRRRRAVIASVRIKGAASWPGGQRALIRAGWLEKTTQAPGSQVTPQPGPRMRISRSFWLWRTEVTQGQFQALMGYNPARFKRCGSRCPVESLNWHEAAAFANALSRKQGRPICYSCAGKGKDVFCRPYPQYRGATYNQCKGWRLPTEAEWEHAYRAGTRSAYYTGGCLTGEQANFNASNAAPGCPTGSNRRRTLSAGRFPANPWGLYDMAGNVWEWVYDGYLSSQVLNSPDPVQDDGRRRVLRGGGWYSPASECHANARESFVASNRSLILGFRIARTR